MRFPKVCPGYDRITENSLLMTGRLLALPILVFLPFSMSAQRASVSPSPVPREDELSRRISAAETYQISGDLRNADVENRAVAAIGLQRIGNIDIEEGRYQDAVKKLSESANYRDGSRVRVDLAVAYLRLNDLDNALTEAQRAVDLDPKNPYAHYVLGNVYFHKEDYAAALPELEKVMLLGPTFDAAHALGVTYLHLKQLDRAKLLFEEIQTTLKKPSADLHVLFGQAFEQTNYPREAEAEFNRALAIDPQKKKAAFYLGYVILQYGGSGRLAEAGRAFERELLIEPNDFFNNFFAGVVASSENDHKKATSFLQRAILADPVNAEAHLFLGQSQFELNDLAAAEKTLRRAVTLTVEDSQRAFQSRRIHYLLGRLLAKTGRKEEAEKELAIAKKLQEQLLTSVRDGLDRTFNGAVVKSKSGDDPTSPKISGHTYGLEPERLPAQSKVKGYLAEAVAQAFHNLGVIEAQTGNLNESIDRFAAAYRWKPDLPGLDRNWGIVAFRANQFDKAIAPLTRNLAANPKDDLVRQMLGTIHYFSKNFKLSVETLKPIEQSLATKPELAYFYGIALVQLERNLEATPLFERLAQASQKNAQSLQYAAQGFMFLGDYRRAAKEFQTVELLAPGTPKIQSFIGQCMIRLNRLDEAEAAFRKATAADSGDESSKYHLAFTLIEKKTSTEEAVTLLNEALATRPDYADAWYQLGKMSIERGEIEKAIEQLETAARSDRSKEYVFYQLNIAYRRASRKADADQALKTYQDLKAASRKIVEP